MPYQPSQLGPMVEDRRGEFNLAKGQAIAGAIDKVAGAFTSAIQENIGNKEKALALDTSIDLINQRAPNLLGPDFLDKFHGAGVSAKAGMMTTALAMLQRQDQQTPAPPVVPQYGKTPKGYGYYTNPKSGAITPESSINPPLPVDSGVPNPNGDGNLLLNSKSGSPFVPPAPPPKKEWRDVGGGVMQHFVNDQPSGAIYHITGKPGMVPLDNDPETFLKVDGSGRPLENGRSFRREPDSSSESGYRFNPIPDAAKTPVIPADWKPFGNSTAGTFIKKGDQIARWDDVAGKWVPTSLPDAAAASAPAAPGSTPPAVPFWKR